MLPAVAVVLAFFGARMSVGVEAGEWVGDATVDSARAVLSTVAAATITFASISFSVSLLIMQQGSTQYSPRVIHVLTRDPFIRRVIAFVVATFTYCLVVIQRVRGPISEGGEAIAPRFAVALGLVLGVVAVLAIVAAIHHTSRQMDVSTILKQIVDDTVRVPVSATSESLCPSADVPDPPSGVPSTVVRFHDNGWVRQIDRAAIVAATPPGSFVRLETEPGRYAIRAASACTIWPAIPADELGAACSSIRRAIVVGPTRTMSEDGAYGVRQLVDIALRALSPGINDPTTAQDAIFHLGSVLAARLAAPTVPRAFLGAEDRRLVTPHAMSDADLAELALSELRQVAAEHPAVCLYLFEMIAEVADAAGTAGASQRLEPFVGQMRLLEAAVAGSTLLDVDRRRVADACHARFGRR